MRLRVQLLLGLSLFLAPPAHAVSVCGAEAQIEFLGDFNLRITLNQSFDRLRTFQNEPTSPELDQYRKVISSKINTDPFFLLKRQRGFFEKSERFKSFTKRYDAILSGKIGKIRSMNCIESYFMTVHLRNLQGSLKPSEFAAWILEDQSATTTTLYFTSSKTSTVGTPQIIKLNLHNDIKQGATFIQHIHSHPFSLTALPDYDVAGTLIPSGEQDSAGDVRYYLIEREKSGLKSAVITNGFDSIEIDAEHFDDL